MFKPCRAFSAAKTLTPKDPYTHIHVLGFSRGEAYNSSPLQTLAG